MVEWNQTYGFLNCRKALALNKDVENQYVHARDGIQLYIYKAGEPDHWGDIHWPVVPIDPLGYDLVLFGQARGAKEQIAKYARTHNRYERKTCKHAQSKANKTWHSTA